MSSRRYIELTPSNQVPTASVSYRNGNNIISFQMGASDMMLFPSSVRFQGKIGFHKSNGVRADGSTKLAINERVGVYGTISQIIIRNGQQQVMEHLKHYGTRFMSSYLPCHTSENDAMTYNQNQSLTTPNWELNNQHLVNGGNDQSFCLPLVSGVLSSGTPLTLS